VNKFINHPLLILIKEKYSLWMRCVMPSPTGNNYDDDDRFPRRRRRKDNPFDEFLNNFMNISV